MNTFKFFIILVFCIGVVGISEANTQNLDGDKTICTVDRVETVVPTSFTVIGPMLSPINYLPESEPVYKWIYHPIVDLFWWMRRGV